MAVLLGPPTVGGSCYLVWLSGSARTWRRMAHEGPPSTGSFSATVSSFVALIGAYLAQRQLLVRHFDEGGALSLDWKKGTESLGEPLKIQTWRQFYRAAGPPVSAAIAACRAGCLPACRARTPSRG